MPSSTFFNLPEPKRKKLLDAATEEFRRAPLAKASINRIIQGAGIPRGSFYMYFEDKMDLFQYLYFLQYGRVYEEIARLICEHDGSLFDALQQLFDLLLPTDDTTARPFWIEDLYQFYRINSGTNFVATFGLKQDTHLQQMRQLLAPVNMETLAVSQDELIIMLELLFSNLGWLISRAHTNALPPKEARLYFSRSLALLRSVAQSGIPTGTPPPRK